MSMMAIGDMKRAMLAGMAAIIPVFGFPHPLSCRLPVIASPFT